MILRKTGIPHIDEQHRKILRAMAAPPSHTPGKEIFLVYDHIVTHFRDEEALMREKKYPDHERREHEQDHHRIQDSVSRLLQKQGFLLTPQARDEIKKELIEHIDQYDTLLADYIRGEA